MTATVRVMTPEEIAARAGGEPPFFHWPDRAAVFAERAMRLRQLAAGHAMGDYLHFMAALAAAQHDALQRFPAVPLPGDAALDGAARAGRPALAAADWPRDPAWHDTLRALAAAVRDVAPPPAQAVADRLRTAEADWLERQADALLHGVMHGVDLGAAPLVAAALQVYWTHMVDAVRAQQERAPARGAPFGRIDEDGACPCCGSRPTASVVRTGGDLSGQRYLHCSLCGTQWHMLRIRCTHCGSGDRVAYQSLDLAAEAGGDTGAADDDGARRAAQAAVQAETCDACGHYLKIMHSERDPFVEPVADDLATLTLDLLLAETGQQRHGVNLMLLFGAPEPPGAAPPDPAPHAGSR